MSGMISATGIAFNAFSIQPNIEWKWIALISFIAFVIIVWQGWYASEHRARQYENSRANIVVLEKEKDEWQFYSEYDGQPVYHALQIWFVNKPKMAVDKSIAKGVAVEINFYDRNTKTRISIFGCFTKADLPDYATILPIKDLLDEIDSWQPNPIPQKLLVALKWPDDENAYAFAKSNFKTNPDGREETKKIQKGEYFVEVAFGGAGIGQPPIWFILTNPGKDGVLHISKPIKKPNLHKQGFKT